VVEHEDVHVAAPMRITWSQPAVADVGRPQPSPPMIPGRFFLTRKSLMLRRLSGLGRCQGP